VKQLFLYALSKFKKKLKSNAIKIGQKKLWHNFTCHLKCKHYNMEGEENDLLIVCEWATKKLRVKAFP
jgi:hypothetical protein